MARPIYYDTETTGIRTDKDRIIEIAAFDPVQNRTFEMLINPGCPIPAEATAIHKITNEMVANSPTFAEVASAFVTFCEGDVILIAHNNDSFDMPMIRSEFLRNNMLFPDWKFMDSLKWARRYRPDLPRHSLQFLREIYNIPANNAHRALDDVIVLENVFRLMIDDIPIDHAFDLLSKPKEIQFMPFGKHSGKPLKSLPADYVVWLKGSGALDKSENQQLKAAMEKLGLLSV